VRILLCSHAFAPNIGGIETASSILADHWTRLGASVTVVTQTPGGADSPNYEVVRQPSRAQLRTLGKKVDLIFQNNISLQTLIPLLPVRKPVVITHQTMPGNDMGHRGWKDYLKCAFLPLCRNIAISHAVAQALPVRSTLIYNPFQPEEFSSAEKNDRPRDIVFMGRLVSCKGCDRVLHALAILKAQGICPTLTVIGDGPEMPALQRMTGDMGLSRQVCFKGAIREGRGREVAQHKIMVIPSVWEEPFGIVALEGLAAGCVLVASQAGGLPEAVGPCGLTFPNGDARALASALDQLLHDASLREQLLAHRSDHLQQFQPEVVAKKYLEIFGSALN
jgi:glycogen synthase